MSRTSVATVETIRSLDNISDVGRAGTAELVPSRYALRVGEIDVLVVSELAANRESLVATHLSFPSVCHVAVDGDVFRWVPGPWEY